MRRLRRRLLHMDWGCPNLLVLDAVRAVALLPKLGLAVNSCCRSRRLRCWPPIATHLADQVRVIVQTGCS